MPCLFLSGCNSEDHCKKSTKCQKDGKTNIYYPGSVCWKQPSEIRISSCTTLRRRIMRYFFGLVHVCASGTHRLGRAPFLHQAGAYKPSGWVLRLVQIVTNA